jgi:hypothetical protein
MALHGKKPGGKHTENIIAIEPGTAAVFMLHFKLFYCSHIHGAFSALALSRIIDRASPGE